MITLKKDKEQYIPVEKEQYLDLIRDVEYLKQKVNTCKETLRRLANNDEKLLELIELLTEKIWGKK